MLTWPADKIKWSCVGQYGAWAACPEEARPQQVGPDRGAHRQAAAARFRPRGGIRRYCWDRVFQQVCQAFSDFGHSLFAPSCSTRAAGDSPLLVRVTYDVKRFAEHLEDIETGPEAP